jgi:type II secretory pathway pseudopilin PulG
MTGRRVSSSPCPFKTDGKERLKLGERGFSLIETVLIIVILSILSVTIWANLGGFSEMKLGSATKKLASEIRYAYQLSTTKQIIHGVSFTATGYTVYENDDPLDPARNPQGGGDFVVTYTTGELEGIMVTTTLPNDIVKFNSTGEALQDDGSPLPIGSDSVTLNYKGKTRMLSIVPSTGKVNY